MSKSVTFCLPASNTPSHHLPRSAFVAPKATLPARALTVATATDDPSPSTTSRSTAPAPTTGASRQPLATSVSVVPPSQAPSYSQAVVVSPNPVDSFLPHGQTSSPARDRAPPSTRVPTTHDANGPSSHVLVHSSGNTRSGKASHVLVRSPENAHPGAKARIESPAGSTLYLSKASKMADQVRMQSNAASHNLIRAAKYEVSRMYECLIKVEEEIKLTHKARHTLEVAVQDIRKSMSLNQQSISSQQKKARANSESVMISLLREEARTLSRTKRDLEAHLHTIRHQLHLLDTSRKQLQAKIASTSKCLELDAQNFRVYYRQNGTYTSNLSQPSNHTKLDSSIEHLLLKTCEILPVSQAIRREVRGLISTAHSHRQEAHKKIDNTLSKDIEETNAQKREIVLERGHLRLQQNLASRNRHREEIAFGIASGPEAGKFKSVSEKEDRPLSHVRPQSAIEEQMCMQETKTKIARQLSATQLRSSALSANEQRLNREIQQRAKSASFDSQSLLIRRMSLDNRWVS